VIVYGSIEKISQTLLSTYGLIGSGISKKWIAIKSAIGEKKRNRSNMRTEEVSKPRTKEIGQIW